MLTLFLLSVLATEFVLVTSSVSQEGPPFVPVCLRSLFPLFCIGCHNPTSPGQIHSLGRCEKNSFQSLERDRALLHASDKHVAGPLQARRKVNGKSCCLTAYSVCSPVQSALYGFISFLHASKQRMCSYFPTLHIKKLRLKFKVKGSIVFEVGTVVTFQSSAWREPLETCWGTGWVFYFDLGASSMEMFTL